MKVEIINKAMLCWEDDESKAREYHVLAKVTECNTKYPFKVICNENTYPDSPKHTGTAGFFKNAKPLPQITEMTVGEISKLLGKKIKIVE